MATRARKTLAQNIRRLAGKRGLALNYLADFADVSRSGLYNVLRGEKAATTDWLSKIAVALEVEVWELLKPVRRKG